MPIRFSRSETENAKSTNHHDHEGGEQTDQDCEIRVADMHTGVLRQACEGDRLRLEAAPVAEADEDEITDAGRHETGQEDRDGRGAEANRALHHQHATDDRSAEESRDGSERARTPEHRALLWAEPCDAGDQDADQGSERDQRPLRTEHRTEGERADRSQHDARRVREKRRLPCETVKRAVAAVARQEAAGDRDEAGPGYGQADDQIPGGRRFVQVVWEVVPEPVLHVVHEGEEDRSDQRGRDADHGAQQHQAEVAPGARLGLCTFAHSGPDIALRAGRREKDQAARRTTARGCHAGQTPRQPAGSATAQRECGVVMDSKAAWAPFRRGF